MSTRDQPRVASAPVGFEERVVALNGSAIEQEKRHEYRSAIALLQQASALWTDSADIFPAMHATLLTNLADAYEHQGLWHQAAQALQDAISVREKWFGAADLRALQIQIRLGEAEIMLGELDSADTRVHLAIRKLRTVATSDDVQLALALSSVAVVDLNMHRVVEAEALAAEALQLRRASACDDVDCASVMGVLAAVYIVEGNNARALPLLTRSIDTLERCATDKVRLAPLLVQRGLVEADDRKYSLAEADMQRAIEILDDGDVSGVNADPARTHLGNLYLAERKLAEADSIIPGIVERQRRLLGAPCRRLAFCIHELARLRAMQQRYGEAGSLFREAINMLASAPLPPADPHEAVGEKEVQTLERAARALLVSTRSGD